MSEHWRAMLSHIPFITLATGGVGINTTRIVEAVLIAGLTAMVTSGMTADKVSARLEERVAALAQRVGVCEVELRSNAADHAVMRERLAACEQHSGR